MFEIVMGIDDFLIQLVKYWSNRILAAKLKGTQQLILTRSVKSSATPSAKSISCDSFKNSREYWRDLPKAKASVLVANELGFSDVRVTV